uniref:V-SNARE coiled-coil homology domain-containing protein n=1 Tax=Entomoneis paludosa TaxID=265537 RepID=A0A7S3DSY7_9STRA
MADNYDAPVRDPVAEKILWSSISRNGTILVEAGDDPFEGAVSQTAHGILSKKATPGWEYFTLKNGDGWFGNKSTKQGRVPRLKGVKFHVYENNGNSGWEESTGDEESIVWVFACVFNPEASSWPANHQKYMLSDVQSFLEKIVGLTDMPRSCDPEWRTGETLSCQASFAPILLQRMQEVTYLGTMARLSTEVDNATELMQSNITAIMEREEKLQNMQEKSSQLEEMATVFKKKSSGVRRRMMMQNAKHGVILGTAITAGVAIVVVPPLIAIL